MSLSFFVISSLVNWLSCFNVRISPGWSRTGDLEEGVVGTSSDLFCDRQTDGSLVNRRAQKYSYIYRENQGFEPTIIVCAQVILIRRPLQDSS